MDKSSCLSRRRAESARWIRKYQARFHASFLKKKSFSISPKYCLRLECQQKRKFSRKRRGKQASSCKIRTRSQSVTIVQFFQFSNNKIWAGRLRINHCQTGPEWCFSLMLVDSVPPQSLKIVLATTHISCLNLTKKRPYITPYFGLVSYCKADNKCLHQAGRFVDWTVSYSTPPNLLE